MDRSKLRLPSRRTVFRTISWSVIIIGILVVVAAVFVYFDAVKRFEVRRVSLPTRVYSDQQPLRPAVAIGSAELESKLGRLGYRSVEQIEASGEFNRDGGEFDIYLRGYEHPEGARQPSRVVVRASEDSIESVTRHGTGEPVETVSLEPELLTSILSDRLENRQPVTLEQVPQHLIDAVIVTEDARFFRHPGVDPFGIVRALLRNVRAGGVAEGGSTLTQQLVKNYYLTGERTLRRKLVEAFMAIILDAKYSKEEILSAYLNDIYLGRDRSISVMGVGQASRFYFGKPVSEISIDEAALLAGIIRSPNNYSPFEDPERALQRRNSVLEAMAKREKISEEQHAAALDARLPEEPTRTTRSLGSIPYFVDAVIAELEQVYGIDDPAGRGLNVYTTVDLLWQDHATRVLQAGLERLEKNYPRIRNHDGDLQGSIIAADLDTGEIRALVGGRDYETSQFNRAISAKRQVGSLFKPFVFAAAFEPSLSHQNITPATLVNDQKFVLKRRFSQDWAPGNYEGIYRGVVTVRQALEQSLNAASVRIGLAAGVDAVIRAAHALGISQDLPDVPSIILGSVEIPPYQMAQAYSTIGRMGSRIPLRTVRFITDEDGEVMSRGEVESVQSYPARDVFLLVNILEGVVDHGTAARARSLGFRKTAAGKTGTTNDKRDAWFAGFTPKTLAVTWVGFDDNAPMGVSGSEAAVPIWARLMNALTSQDTDRDFPVPPGITFTQIDKTTGGLATPFCPDGSIITEAFKAGTQPGLPCPKHEPTVPEPELLEFDFPGFEDVFDPGMPELEGGIFRSEPRQRPDQSDPGLELPEGTTRIDPPEPELSPRQPLPPIESRPPRERPAPTPERPETRRPQPPQQHLVGGDAEQRDRRDRQHHRYCNARPADEVQLVVQVRARHGESAVSEVEDA
ncbi:MAG: PBP1A family penicillin-binding protein, partial [Acidobacteria bacterium]|nr:PBP1A family penicillin-binding protein [Acidobacteriota bacterium]